MNNNEQKQFKDLVVKGIKGSLKKQDAIFMDKKNLVAFKRVQKSARF